MCGSGGTGRRATLRALWGKPRGGSSPLCRTNYYYQSSVLYFVIVLAILVAYQAINSYAAVAELVDALASGASGGNPVEVQVHSAAPIHAIIN